MTKRSQLLNAPVVLATATGLENAHGPAFGPERSSEGNGWARQVPGNGTAPNGGLFAALNRKWVHLSYVLIDVFFISVNGLLAFYLRFARVPVWRVLRTAGVDLSEQIKNKK
jgi:hypothetical protein